jgi:hypothetical protein
MATTVDYRITWYVRRPRSARPQPTAKERILHKLACMLAGDEGRIRPPITLAGDGGARKGVQLGQLSKPVAPLLERVVREARGGHAGKSPAPVEGDAAGPYTAAELRAMNDAFVSAVEHAFRSGRENREAARRNGRGPLRSLGS